VDEHLSNNSVLGQINLHSPYYFLYIDNTSKKLYLHTKSNKSNQMNIKIYYFLLWLKIMSRALRIQYPEAWYHVMHRAVNRKYILREQNHFELFLEQLEKAS
jgi:hypothetical protein